MPVCFCLFCLLLHVDACVVLCVIVVCVDVMLEFGIDILAQFFTYASIAYTCGSPVFNSTLFAKLVAKIG